MGVFEETVDKRVFFDVDDRIALSFHFSIMKEGCLILLVSIRLMDTCIRLVPASRIPPPPASPWGIRKTSRLIKNQTAFDSPQRKVILQKRNFESGNICFIFVGLNAFLSVQTIAGLCDIG